MRLFLLLPLHCGDSKTSIKELSKLSGGQNQFYRGCVIFDYTKSKQMHKTSLPAKLQANWSIRDWVTAPLLVKFAHFAVPLWYSLNLRNFLSRIKYTFNLTWLFHFSIEIFCLSILSYKNLVQSSDAVLVSFMF